MVEDNNTNNNQVEQDESTVLVINEEFVKEYSANPQVVDFIRNRFKKISKISSINLIKNLLYGNIHIHISVIAKNWKKFYQYNMAKFDEKKELKIEEVKLLRLLLNEFLQKIGKDIVQYDTEQLKDLKVIEKAGENYYIVDKHTLYRKARKLICDEGGKAIFKYNFDKPDMNIVIPGNEEVLQRCQIQVLSKGIKFDYPVENEYRCWKCMNAENRKAYETASSNGRIKCSGIYAYTNAEGEPRSRVCAEPLNPDNEVSLTKDAFYYDIGYEDNDGSKFTVGAVSFDDYSPGFYECVLFKIKNPKKTQLYQIIDVREMKTNTIKLPHKVNKENYLITLQKHFDIFIKQQTGMEIYGLYPIKVALIIQAIIKHLKFPLIENIQIVGDASTGKTIVLKYYGFMLNGHLNLSTNGLSISIAAMRGTKQAITLMGKEVKIITTGYLGSFDVIHIDEAGENRELVQNLKTFLLEENYGYDKAGATGVFNRRTAQVNISENLDYNHLGQYRGMIRKAYKDDNFQIGDEEKEPWDENWDLHLPLFKYDNKYLYKVIDDKRTEYRLKHQWWIDGYDYALHERFLFYFYLVNQKQNEELKEAIKRNVGRGTIRENLELMKMLKTEEITNFFKGLIKYRDSSKDETGFEEVDKILDSYGIHADARIRTFYYYFIKISRIVNQRRDYAKEDYDLLKWILEKTNCKLDVSDTVDYDIIGPPDIKKEEKKKIMIDDETKKVDGSFGLPEGEFQ